MVPCLALLVPLASAAAVMILFCMAFLPFILGSVFSPTLGPQATLHLDILLFVLVASAVLGYSASLLLNPSTPILATLFNKILGDKVISKPVEDSMVRLRKAQRNQLNIYASALLVSAAFVALVMTPAGVHPQLSIVAQHRTLNLEDVATPPVSDNQATATDNKGWTQDWVGLGKALILIFLAEIGDKTFFVAMILAMKYDRTAVFIGSMAALAVMTIGSAALGWLLVGLVRLLYLPHRLFSLKPHSWRV
jgi:putative Ca2+/H+ antiporter (TMEM165/GDT1 family)